MSCFAQGQIAANWKGWGVSHSVLLRTRGAAQDWGRGLPQASLLPVAPPAVTFGSEGGRDPDVAQGFRGSR